MDDFSLYASPSSSAGEGSGAIIAMALAMAEVDYFWIANVVYLAFVLAAVVSSVTRIFAYRRGF